MVGTGQVTSRNNLSELERLLEYITSDRWSVCGEVLQPAFVPAVCCFCLIPSTYFCLCLPSTLIVFHNGKKRKNHQWLKKKLHKFQLNCQAVVNN